MLASIEAAYQDPGKQVIVGFMASVGESYEDGNSYRWLYKKHHSFIIFI